MGVSSVLSGVISFKSEYNKKYLRYVSGGAQTHGLVQFSADKPIDAYNQFVVVPAYCDPSLVHIKSCYTNKFLVRWAPNQYYISASAAETNENTASWACTLFKPTIIPHGTTTKVRLMHVQLGRYANCYWRSAQPWTNCLYAGSKDVDCDSCDLFTIINWPSIFTLPKRVAFKGDNNKYLGVSTFEGKTCFQFSYDNPYDPKVALEIYPNRDGTVCVKCGYNGRFWRLGQDDWIVADVDPSQVKDNVSAMFRPNVLDMNIVALLNMSKLHYIKRLHRGNGYNLLCAITPTVDICSPLEVKDLS